MADAPPIPVPFPAVLFLEAAAAGLAVYYVYTHPYHTEYADNEPSTKKALKDAAEAAAKALAKATASHKKKKHVFGKPKPPPDPEPKTPHTEDPIGPTCTEDCPDDKKKRRYTVRVHAQGTDCGGKTGSTIGAPALTKTIPITVAEGLGVSEATQAMLNRTQLKIRERVIAQAHNYITTGPAQGGRFGQKSFVVTGVRGGIRYDVDCFGDGPSFVG